ncbi:MAG: hypothetical protein FWF77_02435 [Defluviitaleaceae bacterium]|nr:hypothetical protein [Defluviitaleaceae bacterium]
MIFFDFFQRHKHDVQGCQASAGFVSESARSLEAGCTFPTHKKRVGECHSPTLFCKIKKARQARIGHRGHVSSATHSLEAGSSFLVYKKARQTRGGNRGHVSVATHSLEAGSPKERLRLTGCWFVKNFFT